ncbi:DUF2203 domain-containing protein [Candidatus Leptofilum sp.]|uniref:DUF2203 domain-containing protein n=1 Tax=Candidatus Leptofilum sp. TaxID=3241576 RepID=UPI003B5AB049
MKYFTVEEANALLPTLKPLMAQLLTRRARASRLAQQLGHLLGDYRSNVGSAELSTLTQDFAAIERMINQIQGYGVLLKDVNAGLLDFLSERNGRDVYLCWKYGEEKIEYFHELHTGFSGRQQV